MIVSPGSSSGREAGDGRVDERRRHHDPDVAGRRRARRRGPRATSAPATPSPASCVDGRRVDVVADALVPGALEPAHHVGAHPAEADHPELHAGKPGTLDALPCDAVPTYVTAMDARELDRDVAGAQPRTRGCSPMLDECLDAARLDGAAPEPAARLDRRPRAHPPRPQRRQHHPGARGRRRGEVVDRYEGGIDGRDAEIEAGAGRPAGELVADVRATIWRLEQTWATQTRWDGRSSEVDGREIPIDRPAVPALAGGRGAPRRPRPRLRARRLAGRVRAPGAAPDGDAWNARRPMGMTGLPPAALGAPPARAPGVAARSDDDRRPRAGRRVLTASSGQSSCCVDRGCWADLIASERTLPSMFTPPPTWSPRCGPATTGGRRRRGGRNSSHPTSRRHRPAPLRQIGREHPGRRARGARRR